MFKIEIAIAEWRRQMEAGGIRSVEVLNELESHLREDVAARVSAGADEPEAFNAAVRQMGEAKPLKAEFAKVNREGFWRKLAVQLMGLFGPRHSTLRVPSASDFTVSAQYTLMLARQEAPRLNHDFIGTEHVLLGLTQSSAGIVPQILQRMGVNSENVRHEIEKFVGIGQPASRVPEQIPFTPRAKQALALAAREAKGLNSPHIGAEHIFLGLLLEDSGVAALVLRSLGVNAEKARAEILREM